MKDDETKESTSDNVLNRVLLGDCVDLMSRMASGSVDFALTDPPYITSYRSRDGRSIANNDNADGCVRLSRKSTGAEGQLVLPELLWLAESRRVYLGMARGGISNR